MRDGPEGGEGQGRRPGNLPIPTAFGKKEENLQIPEGVKFPSENEDFKEIEEKLQDPEDVALWASYVTKTSFV